MARENTLESFELAIEQGADAIELDLRQTVDHHLIVHHDPRIARGLPPLDRMTRAESAREAGNRGFHLPTMAEVFRLCRDRIALNIELKESGLERTLLAAVEGSFPIASVLFTSFLPEAIIRIKELEPRATTGLLLGVPRRLTRGASARPRSAARILADCHADLLLPHKLRAHKRYLTRLREQSIPAIVWTVNSRRSFRRLTDLGIAGIITDRPDKLRAFFDPD